MSAPPLVTVNILAHNRRVELARSLRAMQTGLDHPPEGIEFLVVDNASTDGTAAMLRRDFPDIRVIENENVGAAGWNRGYAAGRGEWFLGLDDDCYLTGDALVRALAAAREHGADLVSFRAISSFEPTRSFNDLYPTGLLSYWGCAWLVSRRAIDALGGYDPNIFIWANELEFTIRFLDRGFRHLFLPEVEAIHMKRIVEPIPTAKYAVHMRHLAYVTVKLLRGPDAAAALGNLLLKLLLGLPRNPGRWRIVPVVLAGARDGLGARAPVRPAVSRLYRVNFREFSSPLFYLRRIGRSRGLRAHLSARNAEFYASRPEIYPRAAATLAVPS